MIRKKTTKKEDGKCGMRSLYRINPAESELPFLYDLGQPSSMVSKNSSQNHVIPTFLLERFLISSFYGVKKKKKLHELHDWERDDRQLSE